MFTALALLSILWGLVIEYHTILFWRYADFLRVSLFGVVPLILGVSYLLFGFK